MTVDTELLHIVQDHELLTMFVDALCCAIENEHIDVPNFIPQTNDALLSEQMTLLAEYIRHAKGGD